MSSEKNTIVRLATLKTPRDLSLGGSSGVTRGGVVRRKFAPNVNAAAAATVAKANQKSDSSTVEIKSEKKTNKKDKSKGRRDVKERRSMKDMYVQKRSVFDIMPTAEAKVKSSRSGYSHSSTSLNASSSSSSLRISRVKVKSEKKMETDEGGNGGDDDDDDAEDDDKELVKKLLTHSMIDDDEDEDEDEDDIQPLFLPLEGNVKKDFELYVDVKPVVKVTNATMEMDTSPETAEAPENIVKNSESVTKDDPVLEFNKNILVKSEATYQFNKGEYYLVQLPSTLPGTPPMTEEEVNNINNNKNIKNKKSEEPVKKQQDRFLKDFPEGHIGRLVVRKGGRTQLLVGKVTFDCLTGPLSECRQELGMAMAGRQRGPYEKLYRFGRVSKSLIVHPDLHAPSVSELEEDNTSESVQEEYNVYLCKPEDKALYLFNLPLKYGLAQVKTGRLKPVSGRVQFDLEDWPTREDDDSLKPRMISWGCNVLPKVFGIGVFNDDQFHLTPLCDIVQMRPEFKSFKTKEGEDRTSDWEDDKAMEQAQVVNAHMKIKETESAKNKRLASYQHLQNEERKEAWHDLNLLDPTEYFRESALLSSSTQPCEFNMPWEDYVEALTTDTKPSETTETSLSSLHLLKLQDQVKWLVERCKAIDFQQLTSLLPPSAAHPEVIGYLEQFSVLIQGCWVVKSEHIISASNQKGVALRALRDFVLYKFSQGEGVTRAQLNSLHRLNDEDDAVVLEGISRQDRVLKQRVFIMDADEAFVKKHDQVAKRQALLMKKKFEQIKIILPFKNSDTSSNVHKQPHSKKS